MQTRRMTVFGDSILKGVQLDEQSRRYVVEDTLGFDSIARRSGFSVQNFSKFGCTVTKAWSYLNRAVDKVCSDLVVMDFGGNDCDFDWAGISQHPLDIHKPNTEYYDFVSTYGEMLDVLEKNGSMSVVMTLVPIQGERYIRHLCKTAGLDRNNILKWLGNDYSSIEHYQQVYSDAVKAVASSRDVPVIDIRAAFRANGNESELICADGIHPNSKGQKVIHDCFESFMTDFLAC